MKYNSVIVFKAVQQRANSKAYYTDRVCDERSPDSRYFFLNDNLFKLVQNKVK